MNEIRTNLDTLYDSLDCYTDNITENSGENGTVYTSNCPGYDGTHYGGYDNGKMISRVTNCHV